MVLTRLTHSAAASLPLSQLAEAEMERLAVGGGGLSAALGAAGAKADAVFFHGVVHRGANWLVQQHSLLQQTSIAVPFRSRPFLILGNSKFTQWMTQGPAQSGLQERLGECFALRMSVPCKKTGKGRPFACPLSRLQTCQRSGHTSGSIKAKHAA